MLASTDAALLRPLPLRIAFAGGPPQPHASVFLDVPWLLGSPTEELFESVTPLGPSGAGSVQLFQYGRWTLGHAHAAFSPDLAARTESLYREILAATRGRHLYRIWNYVPRINEATAGLETYRAFCRGRSLAFEASLGDEFQPRLPAASAVGCQGERIEVIFAAGEVAPTHFENPAQVPAYRYPMEHGPRAPSFARATVVQDDERRWTFISGTSAIKGHQTVAPGALEPQIECTLDNLRLISQKAGLADNLGAGRKGRRHFKVYLRHATDLAAARARLERDLLLPRDLVTYLQADICRAALTIEIEATLTE